MRSLASVISVALPGVLLLAGCGKRECVYDWCWENPKGEGTDLLALRAFSPSDVWAVGRDGVALHFDGFNWNRVPTGTYATLGSIWGAAPNDVWAGPGYNGRSEHLRHWNGSEWSEAEPAASGPTTLSGTARDNVWLAKGGSVRRYDGSSWVDLSPGGLTNSGEGIWGATPDDCWTTASSKGLLHWNGAEWTQVQVDSSDDAYWALWGTGTDDVWALGTSTVAHWDGTAWSAQAAPIDGSRGQLWGTSSRDVWAVAYGQLARWDGSAWTKVEGAGSEMLTIGGTGPKDVWAAGALGSRLHWNGETWTGNNPGVTRESLLDVGGSSASDVWAVGSGGTAVHWDGKTWSRANPVLEEPPSIWGPWVLNGVVGFGPTDAWAVGGLSGNGGVALALHWDGLAWTKVETGAGTILEAVRGSGPNDVWALTGYQILHYDGSSWKEVGPYDQGGRDGTGTAPDDFWALGHYAVLHWDGTAWTTVDFGGDYNTVQAIWARTRADVWVIGDGIGYHWDGAVWTPVTVDEDRTQLHFRSRTSSIASSSPDDIWVRNNFNLYHWDGSKWTNWGRMPFDVIWGAGGSYWGVGEDGAILRYH